MSIDPPYMKVIVSTSVASENYLSNLSVDRRTVPVIYRLLRCHKKWNMLLILLYPVYLIKAMFLGKFNECIDYTSLFFLSRSSLGIVWKSLSQARLVVCSCNPTAEETEAMVIQGPSGLYKETLSENKATNKPISFNKYSFAVSKCHFIFPK